MRVRWMLGVWLAGCAHPIVVDAPPLLLVDPVAAIEVARNSDGDGFVDAVDRCPDRPGIAPDGCPDPDSDGDGYRDSEDACRDDFGVAPDGCPISDSDGDTILDPADQCPLAPETRNGFADGEGCPDDLPADLASITGRLAGVQFDRRRGTLRPRSTPALARVAAILRKYDDVRLDIVGHAAPADDGLRMRVSPAAVRAAAVERWLIEHGILAERLDSRYAEFDDETATLPARDGRVVLTIVVEESRDAEF